MDTHADSLEHSPVPWVSCTEFIAHGVHVTLIPSNGEESPGLDFKRIASKLKVEELLQDFGDVCLGIDSKCFVDVLLVLVGESGRRQREEGGLSSSHMWSLTGPILAHVVSVCMNLTEMLG